MHMQMSAVREGDAPALGPLSTFASVSALMHLSLRKHGDGLYFSEKKSLSVYFFSPVPSGGYNHFHPVPEVYSAIHKKLIKGKSHFY